MVSRLTAACLALFFASLALYQLPDTRLGSGETQAPYFVIFIVPLAALALAPSGRRSLPHAWLAFALLSLLAVATALTGMVHPEQDWLEAGKRIAYLACAAIVLLVALPDRRRMVAALAVYTAVAAGMAVYGFIRLAQGFGEAAHSFYFGLHYGAATRNSDAYFFVLPLFVALGLSAAASRWRYRLPALAVALILLTGMALSQSRGTWIAAAVGLLVFAGRAAGRRRIVLVPVTTMASGVLLIAPLVAPVSVVPLLAERAASITVISDSGGNSNLERLSLLDDTATLIAANPLVGVGVGQMAEALYRLPEFGLAHAESDYLTMWVEYGPPGLLVVFGLMGWPLLRLLKETSSRTLPGRGREIHAAHTRPLPRERGRGRDYLQIGLWCGLLALAINSLTTTSLDSAYFWILPISLVAVA